MSEELPQRKESMPAAHHTRMKQSQVASETNNLNEPKEDGGNSQLSQSLLSVISKVKTDETAMQQQEEDLQKSTEICERQRQNFCDLRCDFERLTHRYNNELKNKDTLTAKLSKTSEMYNAFVVDTKTLTDTMHQIVAGRDSFQLHFNQIKDRSNQMLSFLQEETSVFLPSIIERLQKELFEEKEKNRLYAIELSKERDCLEKQYALEESKAKEELAGLIALHHNLEQQIMAEDEKMEELSKCVETSSKEKQVQKDSHLHRIKFLTEKAASIEGDLQIAKEENTALTAKLQSQQIEFSQNKEREQILHTELQQLKKNVDDLHESQLVKEAHNKDLEMHLDEEATKNKICCADLEDIRHQLQELEDNTISRVKELSEESLRVSSNAAEMELPLQQSLDNATAKEADLLKEENNLTQTLLEMEEELHHLSTIKSQVLQSNSALENHLATVAKEIQDLTEEKRRLNEVLGVEQSTTQMKEQSLVQTKAINGESLRELQHQLECLEHENLALDMELESMKLMEQDLLLAIKEVETNSANTSAQINEQQENVVSGLQVQTSNLENEIEQMSNDCKRVTHKLQQDLSSVTEAVEKYTTEMNNFDASVQKCQSELEDHENSLKRFMEVNENQKEFINGLTAKMVEYSNEFDIIKKEEQITTLKLEEEKLKVQEIDVKIAALELKYEKLQSDFEKSTADNESEKQVFLRDLVKFQQTSECRSNENKGLLKQIDVFKTKIEDVQTNIKETISTSGLKQQKSTDAKNKQQEYAKRLQEWKEKLLTIENESKQAENNASLAKKKVDHLQNKIAAHRAAKKKQVESSHETFKVPSRNTTPQYSALSGDDSKENTPRSILKMSKPPTPQEQKKVAFADDFDDNASSSSSIMLVPELVDQLAKNPEMVNIIAAQHRERHLAAKRMKMSYAEQASTSQEASTPTAPPLTKIFSNEISSSTPENQPSDPYSWSS